MAPSCTPLHSPSQHTSTLPSDLFSSLRAMSRDVIGTVVFSQPEFESLEEFSETERTPHSTCYSMAI